ncbi:MAG: SlyX family protein [Gammaproteobacteria bacterium]|jgi:uncharacterized coiled-coil protein SlyX
MEQEIEKLQLLVMDHETTIETLSEGFHQQQEMIEALQRQLRELASRLESMAEQLPAAATPGHEVPPHY